METAIRSPVPREFFPCDGTGDEWYYGYRTIIEEDENGEEIIMYRPLTLDDFLEPEEGDVYMQGNLHEEDVDRLKSIFRYHMKDRKNITVYSDMKIVWGIGRLKNPAPDISIIENVREPKKPRGRFSVPEEGAAPFFVLEVVSPRYRRPDIEDKPEIYRQAGVSEYMIIDPGLKNNEISYTIKGYRLIGGRYVKIHPDGRGRLYSQTTDVWLSVNEAGDEIIVADGRTGERILSDDEGREQERIRAERERTRAEQERVRADNAEEENRLLKAKLLELGIPME